MASDNVAEMRCMSDGCYKVFTRMSILCAHSESTHGAVVNFKYVKATANVLPGLEYGFVLPADNKWTAAIVDDFEKCLRDVTLFLPYERKMTLTERLQYRMSIANLATSEAPIHYPVTLQENTPQEQHTSLAIASVSGSAWSTYTGSTEISSSDVYKLAQTSGYYYDHFVERRLRDALICPVPNCGSQASSVLLLRCHCMSNHKDQAALAIGYKCYACGIHLTTSTAMVSHLLSQHKFMVTNQTVEQVLLCTNFDLLMNQSDAQSDVGRCFWSNMNLDPANTSQVVDNTMVQDISSSNDLQMVNQKRMLSDATNVKVPDINKLDEERRKRFKMSSDRSNSRYTS